MKNHAALILMFASTLILSGCGGQSSDESMTIDTEQALEEIAALTSGEIEMEETEQVFVPAEVPAIPAMDVAMTGSVIDNPSVTQIQQALQNAGLYMGKVDGDLGPKTKRAILDFQEQNGLTADGKVGPKTWAELGPFLIPSSAAAQSAVAN